MFSFFKKQNHIENSFSDFQNSFNKEQKAAIIGCLFIIATCDTTINSKEENCISNCAEILGISLEDKIFGQAPNKGKQHMMNMLNSLDESQKEWFVAAIYDLILSDGSVNNIESAYVSGISDDLGISNEEFVEIVKKSHLLAKKYLR